MAELGPSTGAPWGKWLMLALALWAMALQPANTVRLTAPQALAAAARLQEQGETPAALVILAGLDQDPSPQVRAEALARRAAIVAQQGKKTEAAVLLRRAVDVLPRSGPLRLRLASQLDSIGDVEGARRQLRAAQAIGLPPEIARRIARYALDLRARTPFGWSIDVALAPDSNINRASARDRIGTVIGDFILNPDSKARSGTGLSTDVSAFARLGLGKEVRWQTRFSGHLDRYRDSQFNRTSLAIATGPEFRLGTMQIGLSASAQRQLFGKTSVQSVNAIGVDAYRPLGRRMAVSASVAASRINNRLNDLQDGRQIGVGLAVDRALSPSAGIRFSLAAGRFAANDPGYSTRSWDVGLTGWLDLGRETLSASLNRGGLEADERLALFPDRRRDRSLRASLAVSTRRVELLGFSPFARLTAERNASTVGIWETNWRRVELGVSKAY